jgi:hypothetical protein
VNTRYFYAHHVRLLNEWQVRAVPSLSREGSFPSEEAAQSFALRLNEWLADKPSPDIVYPFFTSRILDALLAEGRCSEERLHRILDNALAPEVHASELVNEHERRAA